MTQQAVTGPVPERLRLAGDHSHRGRSGPARACGANPLAGFGSEAGKDQHYVLDAEHTQRKG